MNEFKLNVDFIMSSKSKTPQRKTFLGIETQKKSTTVAEIKTEIKPQLSKTINDIFNLEINVVKPR